jgi:hypothetical protein
MASGVSRERNPYDEDKASNHHRKDQNAVNASIWWISSLFVTHARDVAKKPIEDQIEADFWNPTAPRAAGRGGINGSISSQSRSSNSRCCFVLATTEDDQASTPEDRVATRQV